MAAWFQCTHCEARYQFDAATAGRAMACRRCGFVFRVPPVPVSTVPHPDTRPAGGGRWTLRFPSGRQFGPVMTPVIEEWVREGRADGESLVSPEGAEDWYRLADAFPDLVEPHAEAAAPGAWDPQLSPAAHIPAAGLLEFLDDERADLGEVARNVHAAAVEDLEKEVRRAMGAVKLNGVKSLINPDARIPRAGDPRMENSVIADHFLVAELSAHGSCFYAVVPWGEMGRLSHEFFSVLPGRLPHPVALRRGSETAFGTGQWIGINGEEEDVVAVAARRSQEKLANGIVWNWYSERREYTMVQVWGIQAVPLGPEKFVHAAQTSGRGPNGNELGLLWYLERQSAFYRFARRLSIPDSHESHILFGSGTGHILVRLADRLTGGGIPAETPVAECSP